MEKVKVAGGLGPRQLEVSGYGMQDQVLIWNADANLEITSFTARLRDFVRVDAGSQRLHISDLAMDDAPGVFELAHRWALDGETVSFESTSRGKTYRVDVSPLHGPTGEIVGVTGSAIDIAGRIGERGLRPGAYTQAEHHAGIGFWHEDLRTGRTAISGGLASLLALDPNTTALDLRSFDHPEDTAAIARVLNDPDSAERYTCDHRISYSESHVRTVRERVQTIFDSRGVAVARLGTLLDITDFKDREADLAELALSDPLTRLANRALLLERLSTAVSRTRRYGTLCGVLYIDLDGFKAVNDSLGHEAGDDLLKQLANHMLGHFRPTDTVARLGGDEFVVVVEDLYSEEAAVSAAEKLLRSLEATFLLRGRAVHIAASIGVAIAPTCSQDPRELLAIADQEMYRVKHDGGRGVSLSSIGSENTA